MPGLSVLVASLLVLAAQALPAQQRAPSGVHAVYAFSPRDTLTPQAPSQERSMSNAGASIGRIALGIAGSVAGVYAGGATGYAVLPHGHCGCDDPGLAQALLGAAVGSVISAGVLSAIPTFQSTCSVPKRMISGILGAGTGALIGGVVGMIGRELGVGAGYLTGAAIGGGLFAERCGR